MSKNIVLIGMSGAGKTTIGKVLSYKTKKAFLDIDAYIEEKNGMTISEMVEKFGIDHFRRLENEACEHISKNYKNTIISTGGGVILKPENMNHLKKAGKVIYINRTVESILTTLDANKRPLLKNNPEKLYDMYKERHPLYLKYADACVLNSGELSECVDNICSIIN